MRGVAIFSVLALLAYASPAEAACSPRADGYLRMIADAVVVANVSVAQATAYETAGIANEKGIALAKPRRVLRGVRKPTYRIVFDSAVDGADCPGWRPTGDAPLQLLYLQRIGKTDGYRVLMGQDQDSRGRRRGRFASSRGETTD